MSYWEMADLISLAMEMVPELLVYKHWIQLNLGLRARVGEYNQEGRVTSHATT